MNKEAYERLLMDVTEFDTEDVITTSGEPELKKDIYEDLIPTGFTPSGI
ncbi:MAG: hypothetical protein IJI19_06980 [Ruminococcus sp.]|nr:hypothetical protein [Ruminococcus sp.]